MMFGQQTVRKGENLAITRRREAEDKRAGIQVMVDHNVAIGRMAHWEQRTRKTMETNQLNNMARQLESKDKESLLQRRRRLADLLARDEEQYKQELSGLQETSKQRARRMVAVARALKQEREEKRKALAQQQYNRQWRDGCDDLRLIDSDKFRNFCMQGVQQQLVDKAQTKKSDTLEEMRWAKVMEDGRLATLEVEQNKLRERQEFNHETKMALMNQMATTRAQKEAEARRLEEERLQFMRQNEEEAEENRKQQAMMKKAQRDQLHRIKRFNEDTLAAKNRTLEEQRAQEMRDLQQKMEAHAAETNQRAEEKRQMREDIFHYQEYLRQRKEEEKEMERQLEIMCEEETQRANAKRDMEWAKDRLAREQLMADVYQTRMGQIQAKDREALRREEEVALERDAIERELEKARLLEEEEEQELRNKERERAMDLDRQMAAHRHRKQIQSKEERKEFEAAQQAEKQYSAFLNREKQSMWAEKYEPKGYGLKTIPWN